MQVELNSSLLRLNVTTNPYLLPSLPKPYPHPLKKYKKRTIKRWLKDPKHWKPPQIVQLADGTIFCHPSVVAALQQAIKSVDTSGWRMTVCK